MVEAVTTIILTGDCRDILPTLDAGSVQCVVTSPPYFNLRDYQMPGQIGLEPTVESYVAELVAVFAEVRRVLADDGTLWLNLGDSYAASQSTNGGYSDKSTLAGFTNATTKGRRANESGERRKIRHGLKPKDLIGIPWRVAFALQADGWYLRQDIIWAKPNPMPESVTDRCTKSHEYLFLLTKSARYYYDASAIAEPATETAQRRLTPRGFGRKGVSGRSDHNGMGELSIEPTNMGTRNKRSVWTIATQPTKDAHFATFPEALVEPCILAGTSERGQCRACGSPWKRVVKRDGYNGAGRADGTVYTGSAYAQPQSAPRGPKRNFGESSVTTKGWEATCTCNAGEPVPQTVMDPFAGSGTTLRVATRLGRNGIGIELNPEYVPMIERRTAQQGMVLP